ncbi:MAG: hypothetical protein U0575_05980 [Phycisphaerales bacterium]
MSRLNDDQTMHLLRIAASDIPRPMEDLCERLRSPDGRGWLEAEIGRMAIADALSSELLIGGGADLGALRSLKRRAVRLAESSLNARDRLAALIVHDAAIASALVHHGVLLSRRPREEWDQRLIELAASAPEPWRTLFRRAADVESRAVDADGPEVKPDAGG